MTLNTGAIGKVVGPIEKEYDWKDIVLYALGIGAGFDELDYVYEKDIRVIPTFAILTTYDFYEHTIRNSRVNIAGIVHGEHELTIHNPIPSEGGAFRSTGQITAMYDKGEGRGALVIGDIDTTHSNGQKLFTNTVTLFSRLDGGFGGERGTKEDFVFPDRTPDQKIRMHPSPDQPLIFRLSGDLFPLHVDPEFAKASGFDRPIMAGLCTLGFTCRALIDGLFPGDPERLTRIKNRFTNPLYPGTPIEVQIWKADSNKALFKTLDVETSKVVIDRGIVEWK